MLYTGILAAARCVLCHKHKLFWLLIPDCLVSGDGGEAMFVLANQHTRIEGTMF